MNIDISFYSIVKDFIEVLRERARYILQEDSNTLVIQQKFLERTGPT